MCWGRSQRTTKVIVPSELITRLLTIIQEYSVFEFDNKKYQQSFGTTMGSKPAPSCANNFMARNIYRNILEIAYKYIENGEIPMKFLKRFLTTFSYYSLVPHLNYIHSLLKSI